ncbi:hypothetical protein [Paraburkholderia phenazinium]|uniref:Uncharacterized protein n=1 Tax=Paraburkholderia phenazinium TaxID=60549 RepID=A0A1G8BF37_9BURK|nr:hypothetical protein [Paraburkholderia phenazinium]SDH31846.1 hypothetical protein SAMN05216466_10926 [Paraburkholderia phenazinium]
MAPEFRTPFEMYLANLDIALRMLTSAQEWRQHACALEKLRIERYGDALRRTRESAAIAKDWNECQASFQAVLSDYLATTSNIWQQSVGLAVRNRGAFGEAVRDALNNWQSAWADQWKKAADVSGSGAPLREWLQHLEQMVSTGPDSWAFVQAAPQPEGSRPHAPQPVGAAAAGVRTRLVRGE